MIDFDIELHRDSNLRTRIVGDKVSSMVQVNLKDFLKIGRYFLQDWNSLTYEERDKLLEFADDINFNYSDLDDYLEKRQ